MFGFLFVELFWELKRIQFEFVLVKVLICSNEKTLNFKLKLLPGFCSLSFPFIGFGLGRNWNEEKDFFWFAWTPLNSKRTDFLYIFSWNFFEKLWNLKFWIKKDIGIAIQSSKKYKIQNFPVNFLNYFLILVLRNKLFDFVWNL